MLLAGVGPIFLSKPSHCQDFKSDDSILGERTVHITGIAGNSNAHSIQTICSVHIVSYAFLIGIIVVLSMESSIYVHLRYRFFRGRWLL